MIARREEQSLFSAVQERIVEFLKSPDSSEN